MKTLYHKAKDDEFEELDIFNTIERKLSDLVSLTSKKMGLVAELLWRVQRIRISPIDKNDFMGQA